MTNEEAIELLEDLDGAIEDNHGRDYDKAFHMAIDALSAYEPTGRIITKSSGMFQPTTWSICSECKRPIDPWDKFCRHCGVKIKENNE